MIRFTEKAERSTVTKTAALTGHALICGSTKSIRISLTRDLFPPFSENIAYVSAFPSFRGGERQESGVRKRKKLKGRSFGTLRNPRDIRYRTETVYE